MTQTHDDQSIQARIAALEQELAELRQRQAATQGGARVEGDVDTQGGDFIGLFLYHCHNLEHEDMGMMRNFEIVEPGA